MWEHSGADGLNEVGSYVARVKCLSGSQWGESSAGGTADYMMNYPSRNKVV